MRAIRVHAIRVRTVVVSAAVCLSACTTPARSFEQYEAKAAATAEVAASALRTAGLSASLASRGRAFLPSISVAIADAEEDARSAEGTFAAIQPPDAASDRLRAEVERLLVEATAGLADVRILARRHDVPALARAARPLESVADRLERFAREHGP